MRKRQAPTLRDERRGASDSHEVYEHPAYGVIGMSVVTGGDRHLFGSDIEHNQRIRIQIKHAEMHRSLSNDSPHARLLPIIEVELSHSQFAEFITTPNRGEGIPCTITEIDGKMIPAIELVETKQEMFRREIERSAKSRLDQMSAEIAKLGALIESGKLPKGELREIQKELARHAHQLPGSVSFVVSQAEEALEKATTHAKIEIEATLNHAVNRLGIDAARNLGLIPQQTNTKEIEG